MARPKPDTSALLDAMAAHVLAQGLNTASLRPLAKAAGTSDRMLIYHFGSKDRLIEAILARLAETMTQGLNTALPPHRTETVHDCVAEIVLLMRRPDFAPYSAVWLDIVSAAGQGSDSHSAAGGEVIDGFVRWLEGRLPDGIRDPQGTARMALTLIEGVLVMDAVGRGDIADRAVAALSLLDRTPGS